MIPTTDLARRIAALFSRRPTTAWSPGEVKKYRMLVKDGCFEDLEDLKLIEAYYASERKKEDGIQRRDLSTFLNNFQGELDRAKAWKDKGGMKRQERKERVYWTPAPDISDEQIEINKEIWAKGLAELREKFGMPAK